MANPNKEDLVMFTYQFSYWHKLELHVVTLMNSCAQDYHYAMKTISSLINFLSNSQ